MVVLTSSVDTKKGGFTSEARLSIGLGIVVGLGQVEDLFGLLNDGFKRLGVVDSEVGEHLTVDLDTCLV